jgi:response regulator of citrate/malate metabolism
VSTESRTLRVLIVEDEPTAAEALALHVGRVPGFRVVGHVRTGADALRRVAAGGVELVLLDIYLPDMSGLEVLRRLRAVGQTVDVVATTRARDLSVVQAAVSFGVTQYLVKPFTSVAVRQKLERYSAYRASLAGAGLPVAQGEIDNLFGTLRESADATGLPKGISAESLQTVVAALRRALEEDATGAHPTSDTGDDTDDTDDTVGARSAAELAGLLGMSRVTTRRYLEYLVDAGLACRQARYGSTGRPELEYRWLPGHHHRPPDLR